jgi:hypothetical protein
LHPLRECHEYRSLFVFYMCLLNPSAIVTVASFVMFAVLANGNLQNAINHSLKIQLLNSVLKRPFIFGTVLFLSFLQSSSATGLSNSASPREPTMTTMLASVLKFIFSLLFCTMFHGGSGGGRGKGGGSGRDIRSFFSVLKPGSSEEKEVSEQLQQQQWIEGLTARRYRAMFAYITLKRKIDDDPGAGRPSASILKDRDARESLASQFANATQEEPSSLVVQQYFASHAPFNCTDNEGGDGSGGDDSDPAAGDDHSTEDNECRLYGKANPIFDQLARSWMHSYDKTGNHCGWRSVADWQRSISDQLGVHLSRATAFRWFKEEKSMYDSETPDKRGRTAMSRRPNAMKFMKDELHAARKEAGIMSSSTAPDDGRFTFSPHWYAALKESCQDMTDLPGFGIHIIQSLASAIYLSNMDQV